MVSMKKYFKVQTAVTRDERRLCWEFPRLLNACARKGRVIILIDGLNKLQIEDGYDVNMRWLPNTFPGNVRVIVTVNSFNNMTHSIDQHLW